MARSGYFSTVVCLSLLGVLGLACLVAAGWVARQGQHERYLRCVDECVQSGALDSRAKCDWSCKYGMSRR
jgi:hypothetical protein